MPDKYLSIWGRTQTNFYSCTPDVSPAFMSMWQRKVRILNELQALCARRILVRKCPEFSACWEPIPMRRTPPRRRTRAENSVPVQVLLSLQLFKLKRYLKHCGHLAVHSIIHFLSFLVHAQGLTSHDSQHAIIALRQRRINGYTDVQLPLAQT